MKNILKWEMKQTFGAQSFWWIGIMLTAATVLLLPLFEDGWSGYDLFLQGCSDFNSLLLLFIGVYSGIHVTGAFEDRRIQAAVMAGNSRFGVLTAKFFSFSLAIALYSIAALSASAVTSFFVKGMDGFEGSFIREVILRIPAYTLVEVSFVSVCFLTSMLVKNQGTSIAVNFVVMLALNSLGQMILGKEWAEGFVKFTPVGQTFMLIGDASAKNLMLSAVVSVFGMALTMALAYIRFRREELK